ncbi:hypothetical protein [Nocardia asteroides]|uniref:hypothetical protein n=1 Tax=Nocardia asteroides TaxID=1824 RepID=UPI00343C53CE
MGTQIGNGVAVNEPAIRSAVGSLNGTVTAVRTAAKNVDSNSWGSGMNGPDYEAGRAYLEYGKKIDAGIDRVVTWLRVWSTSTETTAAAIGKTTVELTDIDKNNAQALDAVAK